MPINLHNVLGYMSWSLRDMLKLLFVLSFSELRSSLATYRKWPLNRSETNPGGSCYEGHIGMGRRGEKTHWALWASSVSHLISDAFCGKNHCELNRRMLAGFNGTRNASVTASSLCAAMRRFDSSQIFLNRKHLSLINCSIRLRWAMGTDDFLASKWMVK